MDEEHRSLRSQQAYAPPGGANDKQILAQAYTAVFVGDPTKEQQEIVLADLAFYSGYYRITTALDSDAALRHNEGKREVFAHIASYLNLSDRRWRALEIAAREEAERAAQPQET